MNCENLRRIIPYAQQSAEANKILQIVRCNRYNNKGKMCQAYVIVRPNGFIEYYELDTCVNDTLPDLKSGISSTAKLYGYAVKEDVKSRWDNVPLRDDPFDKPRVILSLSKDDI